MDRNFWQGRRVLVTGHTGFKGSWLTLWLTRLGAKVTGYALAPEGENSLFKLLDLKNSCQSVIGDVRDLSAMRSAYQQCQPEVVFHLAAQALVRPSYVDPVGTYATNVMGTVHLLEVARLIPSAHAIVNVTSDKCYENREWSWGYRENEPMGGADPYSNSKGCSELVTSAFRRSFFKADQGLASARAGNVIGGGDWGTDRLIPDCMRALLVRRPIMIRNPSFTRPWQHVLEPLSGYIKLAEKLLESPSQYSEGWNFGPSYPELRTVEWIANALVEKWGNGARWERLDVPQVHEANFLRLDSTLARDRLQWTPRLDLATTLAWVVDWYRNFGEKGDVKQLTFDQIEHYSASATRT